MAIDVIKDQLDPPFNKPLPDKTHIGKRKVRKSRKYKVDADEFAVKNPRYNKDDWWDEP